MSSSTEYCEVCGGAITGPSYEVSLEGALVKVCRRCYEKVAKGRREQGLARLSYPLPKARQSARRKEHVEYELVENFGEIVRQAREKMGWSVQALAARLMESENVVKRIEQGRLRPTIELAKRLERILRVKLLRPVIEEEIPPLRIEEIDELTLGDVARIKTKQGIEHR